MYPKGICDPALHGHPHPAAVLPTHFRMLTAACTPRAFVTLRSTAGQAALQQDRGRSANPVGADAPVRPPSIARLPYADGRLLAAPTNSIDTPCNLVGADAHTPAKRSGASTLGVSARRLPTDYQRLHGSMSPKGTSVGRGHRPLQPLIENLLKPCRGGRPCPPAVYRKIPVCCTGDHLGSPLQILPRPSCNVVGRGPCAPPRLPTHFRMLTAA